VTPRQAFLSVILIALCRATSLAADAPAADDLDQLRRLIKPQADESKWARVAWLTNLDEARKRAAKEDKPLFLWRAGGGDVLGRA
jgi:hypothetical protein